MSKKFFETTLETSGAKFNLTIDVSPTDCLIMCNELFNNLSSDDQSTIINTYLQNNNKKICSHNTNNKLQQCPPL